MVKISSIFVAFLENMNFKSLLDALILASAETDSAAIPPPIIS